jgi:hypothetical protein
MAGEVDNYKPLARWLILEMLSIRSTGALKYCEIMDPGLLIENIFYPSWFLAFFYKQDSVYRYPISLVRPHTRWEV